jgi:hypothetical protein
LGNVVVSVQRQQKMLLSLSSPNLLPLHILVFRIKTIAPENEDEMSHP